MNYFTNYFESVNVGGIESNISLCLNNLSEVVSSSENLRSFINGDDWISDAKGVVLDALSRNDERTQKVRSMISTYETVFSKVKKVLDMQKYMKTAELTEEQLKSYASEIKSMVQQIINVMESL